MDAQIDVRNKRDSRSYDAVLDGRVVGMIVYERVASRLMSRHTIVDPALRGSGTGTGTTLVRVALEDVRASGLTLTNYCSFVGYFIEANRSTATWSMHRFRERSRSPTSGIG